MDWRYKPSISQARACRPSSSVCGTTIIQDHRFQTRDDEGNFRLTRGHWEVLTLEDTTRKLLAAETIRREAFEQELRSKLEVLE